MLNVSRNVMLKQTRTLTRRFAFAAAAAVILPASNARAQTFAKPEPALERIWRLGMDSSQVQWLALRLLDSIGPRLTASPGMNRAQDWIVGMYKSWGVDARKEQYGTWRGWRRGPSHIDLISPRVRTLEGTMIGWSPGTKAQSLEAEPILLPRFGDTTEFRRWLPQVRGKLVMLYPPNPSCRTTEDWTRNATPESAERMRAMRDSINRDWQARQRSTGRSMGLGSGALGVTLDSAGVAGLITYRPKDSRGAMEIFETYTTNAPTIALSCEDYGLVFRLTENRMGPRLRLNLDAELLGEQPVFNVIGTIKGTTKPNEYVMMSAHFDSWDGSSGATDNGTGTLTMLEAMRILKQVLPNPQRTILVGHWSAEEHGLIGSRSWAADHPEIVNNMMGLFNQDNGTGRIRSLSGGGWPDAPNHLLGWWDRLPKEFQEQAPFYGGGGASSIGQSGGGSDNASFACWGAPTFGLGATQWDYSAFTWHTDKDTYDKVVFDDLKGNATLTAMLVYMASEDPVPVRRDRSIALVTRPIPEGAQQAFGGRGGGGRANAGGRGGDTTTAAGRGGRAAGGGGGRGRAGGGDAGGEPTTATCPKGDRSTNPRM
jgi:carboxypeptidase Q